MIRAMAAALLLASCGCATLTPEQARLAGATGDAMAAVAKQETRLADLYARVDNEGAKIQALSSAAPVSAYAAAISSSPVAAERAESRRKIESSAAVLRAYGLLLSRLSSGKDLQELDADADEGSAGLKDALDAGQRVLGFTCDSDLLSSCAADVVKASGGWWLRRRRLQALKTFVEKADPVIADVARKTRENVEVLERCLQPDPADAASALEEPMIKSLDAAAKALSQQKAPLLDWYERYHADTARFKSRAASLRSAVDKMAAAHAKLRDSLDGRASSLKEAAGTLRALARDLEGGQGGPGDSASADE